MNVKNFGNNEEVSNACIYLSFFNPHNLLTGNASFKG